MFLEMLPLRTLFLVIMLFLIGITYSAIRINYLKYSIIMLRGESSLLGGAS
jgi:hypothetical protein